MTDTNPMTNADRQALIRIVKARANKVKRETKMREKIVIVEVLNLMTALKTRPASYYGPNAVAIAEEAAAKANTQIQLRCAEKRGIRAKHAPQLELGGRSRSGEFINPTRADAQTDGKLAEAKGTRTHQTQRRPRSSSPRSRSRSAWSTHVAVIMNSSSFGHDLRPGVPAHRLVFCRRPILH